VQTRFLQRFGALYPQFSFRGVRRFATGAYGPFGFVLRVALGSSWVETDLCCMTLTEGYPQEVGRALRQIAEAAAPPSSEEGVGVLPVLVAPYVSDEGRRLCEEARVGCMDLAGNARLEAKGLYVDVRGKPNPHIGERHLRSPFQGKSEQIARTLLLHPDRQWTMRDLAKEAGVSLGLASMVTTDLEGMGAVNKGRKGVSLFNPADLLYKWSESYELRRSPFRAYRSDLSVAEIETALAVQQREGSGHYALTLWSGAKCLLGEDEVRTRQVASYWTGDFRDLREPLGLGDSGQVNVFVFKPYSESVFWGTQERDGLCVVHPIQLYLDLGAGDERELALAEQVRERLFPW